MMLPLPVETIIEWEQPFYEFDEGGNMIYEICANVTVDEIVGGRIEERQVILRNGTATGRPSRHVKSHHNLY